MNSKTLNVASLEGCMILKGGEGSGGGGGVTINNQEKSLEIVENGTTEVTADAGFTGLGKVIINTNVPTDGGGGGGSDMPVIGDGKTYLYITIASEGRMDVPIRFSQTVANGVTIDWGDGSPTETLSGTGNKNTTHKYAAIGDYVISLDPVDGCTLGFGVGTTSYSVMGSTSSGGLIYCNMLRSVEIGRNVTSLGISAFGKCHSLKSVVIPEGVTSIKDSAFSNCYSLESVVIPEGVTSIGNIAFEYCCSLKSVVIPEGVTSIGNSAFSNCYSLESVVIPSSVSSIGVSMFTGCNSLKSAVIQEGATSIGDSMFQNCYSLESVVIPEGVTSFSMGAFQSCYSLASIVIPSSVASIGGLVFYNCYGMAVCDFTQCDAVPSVASNSFTNTPSDCKFIVPDALYDEWIAATNWSTYASYIIKKSDWDAQS